MRPNDLIHLRIREDYCYLVGALVVVVVVVVVVVMVVVVVVVVRL
jgi:hypothetical protein